MDREAAQAASRECPYCCASGLATIWHQDFRGNAVEFVEGRERLRRTVAYCVCPSGRWMLVRHQKHCRDIYIRVHDLYDVMTGRVRGWGVDDPRPSPDLPQSDMTAKPEWRKLVGLFADRVRFTDRPRFPDRQPVLSEQDA
jgi:hypothetical protein